MIHMSEIDSKHLHVGLSKSMEEEHTTIPAKFIHSRCWRYPLCSQAGNVGSNP